MSKTAISTEQLDDTVRALRECSHHLRTLCRQARAEAKGARAYYARTLAWAAALEADAEPSQPLTVVPGAIETAAGELAYVMRQCLDERARRFAAERRRLEVLHEYELNQLVIRAPPEEAPSVEDANELAEIEALEEEERQLQELQADLAERVRHAQGRRAAADQDVARKEAETAVMQAYVGDRPSEVLDYAKYLFGPYSARA